MHLFVCRKRFQVSYHLSYLYKWRKKIHPDKKKRGRKKPPHGGNQTHDLMAIILWGVHSLSVLQPLYKLIGWYLTPFKIGRRQPQKVYFQRSCRPTAWLTSFPRGSPVFIFREFSLICCHRRWRLHLKFLINRAEKRVEWHRVVGLKGIRPVQDGSACCTGTQYRVHSIWFLGSWIVSQVPGLDNAQGVVGVRKKVTCKDKIHCILAIKAFSSLKNCFWSKSVFSGDDRKNQGIVELQRKACKDPGIQ